MKKINVILSGGVGSRLWPLSREKQPKQYLPIFEGHTLFQHTALRNQRLVDALMVVGNQENYQLSRQNLEAIGLEAAYELIESTPRNTAAAIAFAALQAAPEDLLFITPSDHLIEAGPRYDAAVARAFELAEEGAIVTFGLQPDSPETGYGYIQAVGEKVMGFREKPNKETAENFLKQGNYFWNSGMFCFRAGVFLQELERLEPEVLRTAEQALAQAADGFLPLEASLKIPSISVDYAVMERTRQIKMVGAAFNWSDMGSFLSIYTYFKAKGHPVDRNGNMVFGTALHTEFLGLSHCMLVHTPDALLVLALEHAQDVKKIYERLGKERPELVKG
ncbi:MAG: mannose-1-phosphate guanylyltransferase [Nitritalea sp.]